MIRKLTEAEVEFSIEVEAEHISIEGSFSSGDEEADAALAQSIRDDLNRGNAWAWCSVKVTATWKGFEGTDYLGACSYKSEKDFCEKGGYFEDMKARALDDLNENITAQAEKLEALR